MCPAGSRVTVSSLPNGDVSQAPPGSHVVLEAATGQLLHALRLREPRSLFALRGGKAQRFTVAQSLPSAAIVHYPPPFGPPTEADRAQADERAAGLVGLATAEVCEQLLRAGASGEDLAGDLAAECLASFCATGASRCWRVSEAYRGGDSTLSSSAVPGKLRPPSPRTSDDDLDHGRPSALNSSQYAAPPLHGHTPATVQQNGMVNEGSFRGSAGTLPNSLQEKAVSTAVHVGMRGPAAKIIGAVAAVGCEGYQLYKDIGEHGQEYDAKKISACQYQEKVCESSVTSSARAIGGLAGAAAGQAAIPIPIVGAVIGGIVGAATGGFHASSLIGGAMRLSGGRARGGDDLVRCIEHTRSDSPGVASCSQSLTTACADEGLPSHSYIYQSPPPDVDDSSGYF